MADDKPQGAFARLMASGSAKKEPSPKAAAAPVRAQKPARPTASNKVSSIDCNITILQSDVEQLRIPTYSAATFRLHNDDIEWLKDAAYELSKAMKPHKISQADIVRLSFKIFEKMLEKNREEIIAVLQHIK